MNSAIISRPPGPRTARGRARSSANATQHGLLAHGLLIPGETEEAYREHLVGWLNSLHAATYAEARLIAELADLAWQLARIHEAIHRNVETIMTTTPHYRSLTGLTQAATAVGALLGGLQSGLERDPLPSGTEGLKTLVGAIKSVLEMQSGIDPILTEHELMAEQLLALELAACAGLAGRHHLMVMVETAQVMESKLKTSISEAQVEIEKMRDRMLAELPLPSDADAKKLGRYRAQIENSMSRTLDILGKTKTLAKKPGKKSGGKPGSFGSGVS